MPSANTKRGFGSAGLILVILIIIAGGAYFWSQKTSNNSFKTLPTPTSDTSSWKTYRDGQYGFEVKYPLDFKEQKAESDKDLLMIMKTDRGDSYYFGISVIKNSRISQSVAGVGEVEEINIGNHLGYKYFYTEGAGASEVALIQVGQDALSISFDLIGSGKGFATANDKKIYTQNFFDQIFSTFRFTDPIIYTSQTANKFEGKWIIKDSTNFYNSYLTISESTSTGFIFNLEAQSGDHVGNWSNYDADTKIFVGHLKISSSTAHYEEANEEKNDGTNESICVADFTLSSDSKTLTLDTNCDNFYAGVGVYFSGDYHKDVKIFKKTIADANIFSQKKIQYQKFTELVGQYLDAFNDTAMLENNYTTKDGSEISTFAVAHAYTIDESIIILGAKGEIWAAVIEWNQDIWRRKIFKPLPDDYFAVRYFTTEKEWKSKLPKEIDDWRENFIDYEVIYESK